MYDKRTRRLLLSIVGLVLWASFLDRPAGRDAAAAPDTSIFLTEFSLPNNGSPRNLIHYDNRLWFTDPGANVVGSLIVTSTLDYDFTFFNIPTAGSEPYDLAAHGGVIWFTERSGNKLGKLDVATGNVTEYPVPTANSAPAGITVTSGGIVWLVEQSSDKLVRFEPGPEIFLEIAYPRMNAALEDVAANSSGSLIWFTAPALSIPRLASYDVNTEQFYDIPTASFGMPPYMPSQVTLDAQGNPWVSTHNGLIGRYSPATIQFFRWYLVGSAGGAIDGLNWKAVSGGNQLWFTESNTGFAGRLLTSAGGSTSGNWRFEIAGGEIYGIVVEDDGTVWLADSGNHSIWRWAPPYSFSVYLPSIAR